MSLVAVDLAAKYSAACLMSDDGAVISEWDSWGKTETEFLDLITEPFWARFIIPEVMIVEDLPHGVSYRSLVKRVCQLQGRIIERMDTYHNAHRVLLVAPATWRSHYEPLRKRGTGPQAIVDLAMTELKYQPPDLSERAKIKGGKALARKVTSDYCAAFLIGRWAVDYRNQNLTYDGPQTQRYEGIEKTK